MSDEQKKLRFFVAGDVVKHTKTGELYDVNTHQHIDIFYSRRNVPLSHRYLFTPAVIPFNELEMVEPAGLYMGKGFQKVLRADGYYVGLDNEIVEGYANHKTPAPLLRVHKHGWVFTNDPIFNRLVYGTLYFKFWKIYFRDGREENIEPQFARAFLDSIGLTENMEPRIGNQAHWQRSLEGR